jgi:hypothetical protein
MPHKVNPIDFENSEGNLGIANAMLRHLSEKLPPVSRWLRDLRIRRCCGTSALVGRSLPTSRVKKTWRPRPIPRETEDLEANWEVLSEAIQTTCRRHAFPILMNNSAAHARQRGRRAMRAFIRPAARGREAAAARVRLATSARPPSSRANDSQPCVRRPHFTAAHFRSTRSSRFSLRPRGRWRSSSRSECAAGSPPRICLPGSSARFS